MIKCDVCGYENADTATFCLQCGAPITKQKLSEAIDDISGEKTLVIGSQGFGPKPGAAPPAGGPMKLPPPTLPKNPAAAPAPSAVAPPPATPAAHAPARPVIPESSPEVPRSTIPPTTTTQPTVPPATPAAAMPAWVLPVVGGLGLLVVILLIVVILK